MADTRKDRIDVDCSECLAGGFGRQPMVLRTNGQNGSEFLGCSRYPDCTHTENVPAWVEMERAGAERLPGW